jgi:Tol biopolymer transport system component
VSLVLLVALSIAYFSKQPSATAEIEFSIPPPPNTTGFALDFAVGVSPDGSQIGLRAIAPDGDDQLWVRSINSSAMRLIPGSNGAMGFFWSPDSRRLAFFSDKLRSVDLSGGHTVVLNDVRGVITSSGTWAPDGSIVLSSIGPAGGLSRFSAKTVNGKPVSIDTTLPGYCYEPQILPGGRHVLFGYRSADRKDTAIFLGSLDGGAPTRLISGGSHGYYTRPPGSSLAYIVFERNMVLMAQAFDEQRRQMTGEAWAISSKPLITWRAFSASTNGVIAFRSGNAGRSLAWFNRKGQVVSTLPFEGDYRQMALSPDESMLAAAKMDESSTDTSNIWLMDLTRGTSSRLTSTVANDWFPLWSPDGREIGFASSKNSSFQIYIRPVAAMGEERSLVNPSRAKWIYSWSPDKKFIACWVNDPTTRGDIWLLPVQGDQPFPFLRTEFDEIQPDFSPDGRWIAYTSNESGRSEVYARRFEGKAASGPATRLSIVGGSHPKWRQDGRELFFLAPNRKLMSVEVHMGPDLKPASPTPLFQTRIYAANFLMGYAPSKDGQRFLINAPTEEASSGPVTVIVNWNPSARH